MTTRSRFTFLALVVLGAANAQAKTGNVIFIHPDGTGVNTWGAARHLFVGPDGSLNWDKLERMAVYKGHMSNALAATSNGGGTAHAYGMTPTTGAFGRDQGKQLLSASGKPYSIMVEAKKKGYAVGVISSAGVVDAGTGVFLASTNSRRQYAEIARQMLGHKPEVMLGGGEAYFLPKGTQGRHGEGIRTDGRNLIDEARKLGYRVVFTRAELKALPKGTQRVLGLFAHEDTFNDNSEETNREKGLPLYVPTAPTVAEMLDAALKVFQANRKPFFVVAEEEGTDNFAGDNNAIGVLEALKRADAAIGVALRFLAKNPKTLVLTAADSDCSGMQVVGDTEEEIPPAKEASERAENGAPYDGQAGTKSLPFLSAPDKRGKRHPFLITWAADGDLSGGIVAKAKGLNEGLFKGTIRNIDIYRFMYITIFGREPGTR